jgi:hypothetical protein
LTISLEDRLSSGGLIFADDRVLDYEGIVSKRLGSLYRSGSGSRLKIRRRRQYGAK